MLSTQFKLKIAGAIYKVLRTFGIKQKQIVNRAGINYELDLNEGIDLSIYLFGVFQKHVLHNKQFKIPSNSTILDIGGNIGSMALSFAKIYPTCKVISFEPTEYALAKFKRNLELNKDLAKRIEVINCFLSDKSAQEHDIVAYSSWDISNKSSHVEGNHPVHGGTPMNATGVPAFTLDEIIQKKNIENVSFIKIDTDGHEYKIISGAADTINSLRPAVIFEIGLYIMKEHSIDFSFYDQFFKERNYKIFDSDSGKELKMSNFMQLIPEYGTVDLIAIPNEKIT